MLLNKKRIIFITPFVTILPIIAFSSCPTKEATNQEVFDGLKGIEFKMSSKEDNIDLEFSMSNESNNIENFKN